MSSNRAMFTGNTADMNGNVFQCYEEQSDRRQYAKMIEALDAYVKKKLTFAADMAPLFASTMAIPAINLPNDLAEGAGETMKMIFAEEIKEYVKRVRALASTAATVYTIICGQCSEDMKARIKTRAGYIEKIAQNNCFRLLSRSPYNLTKARMVSYPCLTLNTVSLHASSWWGNPSMSMLNA